MVLKSLVIGAMAFVAVPAVAQTVVTSTVQTQALSPSLGETQTLAIVSPEQAQELIGAPLQVDPSAPDAREDVSLYVIESGEARDAASWTAADSEACKASGGIELPLPAGRRGCFQL